MIKGGRGEGCGRSRLSEKDKFDILWSTQQRTFILCASPKIMSDKISKIFNTKSLFGEQRLRGQTDKEAKRSLVVNYEIDILMLSLIHISEPTRPY